MKTATAALPSPASRLRHPGDISPQCLAREAYHMCRNACSEAEWASPFLETKCVQKHHP